MKKNISKRRAEAAKNATPKYTNAEWIAIARVAVRETKLDFLDKFEKFLAGALRDLQEVRGAI